jgi:hypothetical protein
LSPLASFTVLAWLRWDGGDCWQRVLDFGASESRLTASGVTQEVGALYLPFHVAPRTRRLSPSSMRWATSTPLRWLPLETAAVVQLGAVFEPTTRQLRLVVNGVVVAEQPTRLQPATLRDADNWLGRSQYVDDPYLKGSLTEFRIYDQALGARALARIYSAGPDAL